MHSSSGSTEVPLAAGQYGETFPTSSRFGRVAGAPILSRTATLPPRRGTTLDEPDLSGRLGLLLGLRQSAGRLERYELDLSCKSPAARAVDRRVGVGREKVADESALRAFEVGHDQPDWARCA
jgi:hypothetical protein